jgi:copper chaperone
MEKVTLHAPDISCMHCVMAIKRAVGNLEGVSKVEGDPNTKRVEVTYDPQRVTLEQIMRTMAEEGYPVSE